MGLFDRLFGSTEKTKDQPDIPFGRYSDSYKSEANYDAWDRALQSFDKEEYLEAFRQFFVYLGDPREANVLFSQDAGDIHFELLQGSRKISGLANAKIAYTQSLNVGFMRRLLEQNFELRYSRYALDDDNNLIILFDTYAVDASPYKLYYALKELATNADKQDDLLLDEFRMLSPVDIDHLVPVPEAEKAVKYEFIVHETKAVLDEIENGKLHPEQYPGAMAYLMLHLTYKLDYLTKPEGYMMETLERINRLYFAKDEKTIAQKNAVLRKEFQTLLDRSKDAFFKEMYRVKATFGITVPANHDRLVSFIDGELHHMDWYHENKYEKIAIAIPGYITGYCLFHHALPKPDRELLHLYFQITEIAFFRKLGFSFSYYDPATGTFDQKAIRKAIKQIQTDNRSKYPQLNPMVSSLRFDSLVDFAKSFLLMVRNLDMTKAD